VSDRPAAAFAEINGMLDGVDAPTELVTMYCAQCFKGKSSPAAIGHVYRTREGMVLYASWDRTLTADDVRRDAGPLMVFLSDPWPVVMEVDNWLGHCEYHGWRHLPGIDILRHEAMSRHRVSLRC